MQIIMGRATNICSTFHTPHHALFRRWRVVHSVHASSRIRGIYILIAKSGRDGKEKKRGAALPVIPHPREKRGRLPPLSFTRRYEYYASLVYRGEKDASKDVRNCVCSYIISNYVQRNSK